MRTVAPYTGAWIEIRPNSLTLFDAPSLPTRERGLKSPRVATPVWDGDVAPYTGAWIEITIESSKETVISVAPYTGAWIEIGLRIRVYKNEQGRSLHGSVD